jgi:hypothetical protein
MAYVVKMLNHPFYFIHLFYHISWICIITSHSYSGMNCITLSPVHQHLFHYCCLHTISIPLNHLLYLSHTPITFSFAACLCSYLTLLHTIFAAYIYHLQNFIYLCCATPYQTATCYMETVIKTNE